jgi:hypothetical protein
MCFPAIGVPEKVINNNNRGGKLGPKKVKGMQEKGKKYEERKISAEWMDG